MITRAAEPGDYSEIYEMMSKAFKPCTIERTMIRVTTGEDPNFKKGDLRVVEIDGKIVSMMMLARRQLRIGTAILNGAIVGPVATDPGCQRKGHCSAVMRDAVRYMKAQGFDITILWGVPWLYPHYGYSPAMMKTEMAVKPSQGGSAENLPHEARSFGEADLEQITHIYHSNTATRTLAEIRSSEVWDWKPGGPEVNLDLITDRKGEVIGYFAFGTDWGRPCVHEIGVLNHEACGAIFNTIVERAKKQGLKEFYCIIHPDHPFARFAFWHDGEIRVNRGGGAGMARVTDLASLLAKMEKELYRRLCHSELHDLSCTLKISSDEGFAFLNIEHGQVSSNTDGVKGDYQLDVPLACLNPLITGYRDIKELVHEPHVEVGGGKHAIRLIEVLFPTGFPFGGHLPIVWE